MLAEKDKKRFWKKVDVKGIEECWPWKAGHTKFGHGVFSLNGEGNET